jgi:hypothetical protein
MVSDSIGTSSICASVSQASRRQPQSGTLSSPTGSRWIIATIASASKAGNKSSRIHLEAVVFQWLRITDLDLPAMELTVL